MQLLPQFQAPNPGLTFDFQLVNVEDFNGVGESEPNPYFYQVSSAQCCTHTHTLTSYNPFSQPPSKHAHKHTPHKHTHTVIYLYP